MHPHVAQLTLEEKASLVSGDSFWKTRSVDRLGITARTLTDGPHGVRYQKATGDHLGVFASEPATSFPTASATGSTWDPALLHEMGRALGTESKALGVNVLLGPGVNMKRSPLCGRNFEYFAEDPLLAGVLGAAWIDGIQEQGVGASLKHYAANNQETDRMRVNAQVDERTLREIYLPAFEHVVKASQPATVMCAYNKVNGTFASEHHWLLTDVLRGEWGFAGYVVSDWGAVVNPVRALAAGLDLEMPSTGERSPAALVAAVRAGELDESLLDAAVSRLLTVHDRFGEQDEEQPDFDAHHDLAKRIAAASTVMLANDGGLLPLDAAAGGSIAVIGEFARSPRYQGAGSSHIKPTRLDDALTAILATTDREIVFAPGFRLDGSEDNELLQEATQAAATADVAVLFLGLPDAEESEGFDRTHLRLPEAQYRLVSEVLWSNPNTVVVLSNGGVVDLTGIAGHTPAILESWLGGQAGGSAIAEILFGIAEPGGRLAETIPLALTDTPAHVNWPGDHGQVAYGERLYIGYRWYDTTRRDVAFPFGYGLGYTTFNYSDLRVQVPDITRPHAIVTLTVENTGTRAGADVVQLYVSDTEASVDRPLRELKGFQKVHLQPGERREVVLELDERAFAFWSEGAWTVEPGEFIVAIGKNSRDLAHQVAITLNTAKRAPVLDEESTVHEWLDHPVGSPVLQGLIGQMGPEGQAMLGEEMLKMLGSMPLRTMLNFGAQNAPEPIDVDEVLAALLQQSRV